MQETIFSAFWHAIASYCAISLCMIITTIMTVYDRSLHTLAASTLCFHFRTSSTLPTVSKCEDKNLSLIIRPTSYARLNIRLRSFRFTDIRICLIVTFFPMPIVSPFRYCALILCSYISSRLFFCHQCMFCIIKLLHTFRYKNSSLFKPAQKLRVNLQQYDFYKILLFGCLELFQNLVCKQTVNYYWIKWGVKCPYKSRKIARTFCATCWRRECSRRFCTTTPKSNQTNC